MFLKRLSIKGFKSFADTAVLDMEPGVTVVVGPNGSGKSNVVDALAWVLGAQAPSAVRSQKMDDVIFAGTATRAARDTPAEPVPLHIRNAPTGLMKDLGYGAGYRYDHDWEEGVAPQSYLPEGLEGRVFYEPGDRGTERDIADRLQRARDLRSTKSLRRETSDD